MRTMFRPCCLMLLIGLGDFAFASGEGANDPGHDFFEKRIRPALVGHCYSCHSMTSKKKRGGLLLDSREAWLKGGDTGPAVVAHKPKESLLLKAIRYEDAELKMPPKGKLDAAVIADFEKWIAMGAPGPRGTIAAKEQKYVTIEEGRKFWAFQPPKMPAVPRVKRADWPHNDLDRFVLARLEEKGLQPAGDADPATLLRRLYFVLIGLPPTPEEVDEFVKDSSSPLAPGPLPFLKVVDRLLASPHFGERWGRHWLDVARYAESSGGGRSLLFKEAWRYRDYVIRAFNSDLPFSRFIMEQLAGDLLEAKTPEERYWQLVATAFLLLGPTNYERQDKPILEMDIIDEQLDTMGKAFLGMTIGCARCHDHKFDPIPTRDYYALAGIFKSTKFIVHDNVSKWMERPLPMPPEQEQAVRRHDAAVAKLQAQIKTVKAQLAKEGVIAEGKGMPLAVKDLPGIVIDDKEAKKVGAWKHSTFMNQFIGDGYLYDDRAMAGEKTLTFQPDIPRSGFYEVRLAYLHYTNRADKVGVRVFHTDGDNTIHVNQKQPPPIDGRWLSLGRFRFEKGNQWFVMLTTEGANGHVVADAVQFLSEEDLAKSPPIDKVSDKSRLALQQLEAELKRLQAKAPERPIAMAVADAEKIEDCHVCVRGNVHNRGDKAARGFLQVATRGSMPQLCSTTSGRRELALWIASRDNPLTARVLVNRVWQHAFGAGLVRTVDNFGVTGERPSHPELLDYLAVRFMDEGWSIKKLIRTMVLSRTFQMKVEVTADGHKIDPENRLLWRMNRRRLDAEALRDAILLVSGKLDRTTYGPTIRKGTFIERDYQFDDVRRSIYTPVFRNRLLDLFEVFDFPDPNMVVGRRNVSTVPSQALYLLNSPFVMAQSRHAAENLLKLPGLTDEQRIDLAYKKALGRPPTEHERQVALAHVMEAGDDQRLAAWERFCQTLFASLDFRFVN